MTPDDGRVVSNFIVHVLREEKITIYGNGTQTRCFQYMDDLIEAMTYIDDYQRRIYRSVNTDCPKEYTILELVETIDYFEKIM